MSAVREKLLRRPDVPNEQIDDVIERAQALQDEALEASEGATLEELEAVARELEIDPRFVEEALEHLKRDEEHAAAQAEKDAIAESAAQAGRTRTIGLVLAGLLALGAGFGGLGLVGSSQLAQVTQDRVAAEVALDVVLDRQAALLPQLVALSGGDGRALAEAQESLAAAETIDDRLDASQELSISAAELLAQADESTVKTEVQFELTGTQNRITTERRRYEEALRAWEITAKEPLPRLAITLGMD
ncbi:MAG: LemA family protein [Proteobacteria bacterium]|nr:LemA family protein [Pseudomonadota bacterium]MCP4917927.1 LemA family protein [Pseudomonadota bacterium]